MVSARAVPAAGIGAGVGEVDIAAAANVVAPPNANENLTKFVVADPTTGAKTFDVAGWTSAVSSSANWTTANWSGANWSGANWSTANWATASWSTANWATANWTTANWATANWTDAGNAE
jgi:uncharacterized protein YjbI with pentapeptide repeats